MKSQRLINWYNKKMSELSSERELAAGITNGDIDTPEWLAYSPTTGIGFAIWDNEKSDGTTGLIDLDTRTAIEIFKEDEADWLNMIIDEYADEMEWDEGMNSHPSDYFTDTRSVLKNKLEESDVQYFEDDLSELQNWMESEIIEKVRTK